MLNQLLSQGESSRLNKALVEESQVALFSGAFTYNTEHPGLTLAYSLVNMTAQPQDVEKAVNEQVELVKTQPISDRELQKLRNQVENDFVSRNSSVAGIAESLANYYMYFGETNLINTEIQRYMQVTKEDIQRVANTYYNKDNSVVLYFMNRDKAQ
jgi:predicted Zn-dependent peptidase